MLTPGSSSPTPSNYHSTDYFIFNLCVYCVRGVGVWVFRCHDTWVEVRGKSVFTVHLVWGKISVIPIAYPG